MKTRRSVKGFRISDDVHAAVELRAALTGKTMADVVEDILREALVRELALLAAERQKGQAKTDSNE